MLSDFVHAVFYRGRHRLVHGFGIGSFDEIWSPAIAAEKVLQFLAADARQQRWIVDLVAVEMKDRQHGSIADGIEEFVDVPCRGQRSRFGFSVADDCGDDGFRIVECCAARVRQDVPEFSALVDRSRSLRRAVAADSAGERKLSEEFMQTSDVFAL